MNLRFADANENNQATGISSEQERSDCLQVAVLRAGVEAVAPLLS